jgi:acetyltransferase-like isoleucine patch superfamily enzyme
MNGFREFCISLAERLCERLAIRLVGRPKVAKTIANTLLQYYVVFGDESRVRIAPSARINNALLNVQSGQIVIEDDVSFGHNVSLLTGTHLTEAMGRDRMTAVPPTGSDITVCRGAWVASNATILGPVRIGEHAVVAAGAVVTKDVASHTLVAGVPAVLVRRVDQ